VRLVPAEPHLLDAALAGDASLAKALGPEVVAGWATFAGALQSTRDALAADPSGAAWGARLFVAGDPPELVGWSGFKGPPNDGVVEQAWQSRDRRWTTTRSTSPPWGMTMAIRSCRAPRSSPSSNSMLTPELSRYSVAVMSITSPRSRFSTACISCPRSEGACEISTSTGMRATITSRCGSARLRPDRSGGRL
jgi:hypothetical protein